MHSITLMQGILLSVMAIIVGFDFWLEGLYIFRPIIVCTLAGLILGDLKLGLVAGGLTELAFTGLTPVGGTQPPNPILAGIMTTVIAYTTGSDVKATIGLALPFSFLMQYIILFYYSVFSVFMNKAEKYADEADTKSFAKLNIITTLIVGLTYGVVVFLCTYVAQAPMQSLVQSMPQWLKHGFEIAGGILPAVGFGLLLKVMLKIEYVPFLIIGFITASFLNFSNLLPVALIGAAFALYVYFNDKNTAETIKAESNNQGGEDYEDGI
ncbi:PTS galactosamine transporter subunit IIC [Clostridium sp. JN-9]|uniref:PTS galactosamine transporter subunit IIC n=1 Tax=Clostridium sp. JN-9 TaxID=2507159 RepID=UPI000FFE2B29|nr:PTS galactosamine transporter subunit IIC [Clostridium sp. JN-9]QAT39167.1 PTS N-acetylgalactosamine transporter subunit IIC [Clostridium sp. JN-9]